MSVTWKRLAFSDDIKPASQIEVSEIGTSTYDDVQDWLNNTQSSGYFDGGLITDAGSGEIDVSAGSGFIRATNSGIAEVLSFDWAASSGIALTDHVTNYVYVNYGSPPTVGVDTTKGVNSRTKFYLGKVFREGTDLHILQAGLNVTEVLTRIQGRINSVHGEIQHASGMALSEIGTRNLAVTAGVYYAGFTRATTAEVDTSDGDTFEYYYLSNGSWVESDQSTIDNVQYNDVSMPGSEALANVSLNNYGVHWVYMDIGGDLLVVYGQGDYNKLSDAEAAHPPTVSYGHVADMSILIGRIIIERNGTSFDAVESAFDIQFSPSIVTEHEDLAGLSDDDHPQYLLHTDTDVSTDSWVVDEDDMASDLNTKVPTQQSVKAYVDAQVGVALQKIAVLGTL